MDTEEIRKEATARIRRFFVRRRLEEFIDALLDRRSAVSMEEVPVEADEDYVRLLYLASYGLDGGSPFKLFPSMERIRRGPYGYPGGRIERAARRRRFSVSRPDESAKRTPR